MKIPHACKNKQSRTHTNANVALQTGKYDPRTRCLLQGWPPSSPRLPRPPGSPRLGHDSVGNSVLFGRAGEEQRRRGYVVVSGAPLKAKQDVWSQILSRCSPPLLQLRGRRQHDTSQPESSRKMRKGCGGNHTGRHQTGHNLKPRCSNRAV